MYKDFSGILPYTKYVLEKISYNYKNDTLSSAGKFPIKTPQNVIITYEQNQSLFWN